jgi:hypothetical protein
MTKNEKKFDKLTPAEQVAINTMAEKVEANELIDAYKEKIAQETLKKKPMNAGEIIFIILLIGFALLIFFLPMIQLSAYTDALRVAGPAICHSYNSTYINTQFGSLTNVKIICEGFTITLP